MNLADLTLAAYGAIVGFALGCAATATVALGWWSSARVRDAGPADADQ